MIRFLRDSRLMFWLARHPRDWRVADEPCECGCGRYDLWIHPGAEVTRRTVTAKQRAQLLAGRERLGG